MHARSFIPMDHGLRMWRLPKVASNRMTRHIRFGREDGVFGSAAPTGRCTVLVLAIEKMSSDSLSLKSL